MRMILNNELIANFLAMNYLIIIINTEFEIYETIDFVTFFYCMLICQYQKAPLH